MKFKVYVDYLTESRKPFYVGKGLSLRVQQSKRNVLHTEMTKGREWYRVVVNETDDEAEAYRLEKHLVRDLGTRDHLGGANRNDGGSGTCTGVKRSPEAMANIRAASLRLKGRFVSPETRAKQSAAHKGRKPSLETRAKMSAAKKGRSRPPGAAAKGAAANRGRKHTAESRANMSAAQRGRVQSPEHRAKIAAAHRGKKRSPETCARIAAAKIGRKRPPESVEKSAAGHRGMKHSPEARAKMSATRTGSKQSPEACEKHRVYALAYWARKKAAKDPLVTP